MILGFTGTQVGATQPQLVALTRALQWYGPDEFRHGDCIGADAQAHECAMMYTAARIVIHPPVDERKRAWCSIIKVSPDQKVLEPKPYLDRNKDIVNASDILIATPQGPEELRSGTWSTVRYARKRWKPILILWPDGSQTWEPARVSEPHIRARGSE